MFSNFQRLLKKDMTSFTLSHHRNWSPGGIGIQENLVTGKKLSSRVPFISIPHYGNYRHGRGRGRGIELRPVFSGSNDSDHGLNQNENDTGMNYDMLRENLERSVGTDDSGFSGIDLATLIRNKYGRSYDVQLINQEFMGRNFFALNVMWKYREQKSFPLSEEEYLLRLDDVANTLKCWGAVSHIRNSLENSKDRPRIGKAVSIFIDMDESGGRANEWIYK